MKEIISEDELRAGERPFAAYSQREQTRRIAAPSVSNHLIVAKVQSDRKMLRFRRRVSAVGAVLAASVIVAIGLKTISDRNSDAQEPVFVIEIAQQSTPPAKVGEQFAQAGQSLASITQQAIEPTQTFVTTASKVELPKPADAPGQPAWPEFDVSAVAQAGFEPVANQPRRAVNAFLRDFGMTPTQK